MFAVPGWSVSPNSLRSQVIEKSSKADLNSTSITINDSTVSKPTKKRKRSHGKLDIKEINDENFTDLWGKVIEGQSKKIKKNKTSSDKKPKIVEKNAESTCEVTKTKSKLAIEQNSKIDEAEKEITEEAESNENKRTKEKKKRKEKKKTKKSTVLDHKDQEKSSHSDSVPEPKLASDAVPLSKTTTNLTPLQDAMRQKLISARFRHLNQTLYTTTSTHSLNLFQENPEMFDQYHEGFRRQVEVWPENPVDSYVSEIKTRGQIKGSRRDKGNNVGDLAPLPRTDGICKIADLGCGDAALSAALQPHLKKFKLQVLSFDLQSTSKLVTKADIAQLPLEDSSIDVAIFCLALMGTNWINFIEEAFRVLRWKGELWIAEIKSRFGRVDKGQKKVVDHSVGHKKRPTAEAKRKEDQNLDAIAAVEVDGVEDKGATTNVSAFVEVLRKRGFVLGGEASEAIDLSNKMFVKIRFVKGITPMKGKCVQVSEFKDSTNSGTWKKKSKSKGNFIENEPQHVHSEASVLKPCVYKLR